MDGYAVRAADTAGASEERPARLRVIGTLAAGRAPDTPVGPGEALRIMTGAPFPDGADAVAIVETTRTDGEHVLVSAPAAAGRARAPGRRGHRGGPGGVRRRAPSSGPATLACCRSVGREKVAVVPAPVVGVLSTGDELVEGAAPLLPGQIRDSNRRTLIALLRRDGFGVVDLGIARDDEADIEGRLRDGAARCDAVLPAAGSAWGTRLVKAVLDRIGRMHWMQVAIRPAKPFAFGVIGEHAVFGLPGNPVSSMVSYEVLARPGLRRMAGRADADLRRPIAWRRSSTAARCAAPATAGPPSSGCGPVSRPTGAATCAAPAARVPTSFTPWPRPTGWPWWPRARRSPPAPTSKYCCSGP